MEEELRYHSERASREMDLGLVADGMAAARAHLQLASMHLERVRELSGQVKSPLSM